jgi:hypothetical protein
VVMLVPPSTWDQRDQLLTSTLSQRCRVQARLATQQELPKQNSGTELNLLISISLSRLEKILKQIWSHTFLQGTSSMQVTYQRMLIHRFNKIEVSMTAKSLSIASMKITPLTSKLPVLNMSQHYHRSRKIMLQVLVQTGLANQFLENPSAGLTRLYLLLRVSQLIKFWPPML